MIGVIGGTNFVTRPLLKGRFHQIQTKYGTAHVMVQDNIAFIQRHYKDVPAHLVNHRANMLAMKQLDIDQVIGICSCGSLKKAIRPGSLVVPHDYINLWHDVVLEEATRVPVTPSLENPVRKALLKAGKAKKRAVYVQTQGPRLETAAEIVFLAKFADLVGMTMASEASVAQQLGLQYAAVCSVDNWAHGIGPKINIDDITAMAAVNAPALKALALKAVKLLEQKPVKRRGITMVFSG